MPNTTAKCREEKQMRVLLKHKTDASLVLLDVDHVLYEEMEQEIYFYAGESMYRIEEVKKSVADEIILKLYESGAVNLSAYKAMLCTI